MNPSKATTAKQGPSKPSKAKRKQSKAKKQNPGKPRHSKANEGFVAALDEAKGLKKQSKTEEFRDYVRKPQMGGLKA